MLTMVRLLALFGACMVLLWLSLKLSTETERIAAIWPLNAIVLALLHRQSPSRWPAILATVFLASATASLTRGMSAYLAFGFAFANQVEIVVCARLLLMAPESVRFDSGRWQIRFFLVAALLGPLCSAFIASLMLAHARPMQDALIAWFLGDSLGMLLFAPALLIFGAAPDMLYRQSTRAQKLIASLGLGLALMLVFAQNSFPLLFIIPPALAWASFNLGLRGAAVGILATAMVAIVATMNGLGPVQLVQGGSGSQFYLLQAFLAFIALTTLPIAAALGQSAINLAETRAANEALKSARQTAEEAQQAALKYAQRYRDLAEYATDIVLRYGPGGVISYASPAIRILGVEPDDVIGTRVADLVLEEDRNSAQITIDALFQPSTDPQAARKEFRARAGDGEVIWLEGNPNIIRDPNGTPKEVVCLYRDVTARRAMEADLDRARVAAEKAAAAKAEFLANMSHELRTPLNSIVGFSQLLRDGRLADPRQQRYVDVIADSSLGLLSVVNDVLDYSSLEAGAVKLEQRPFSILKLANQSIESFRIAAEAKGLALPLKLDESLADRYLGDEGRIRQVLLNLLSNALKFTQSGTVTLSITASESTSAQDRLTFAVIDTGPGVPKHQLGALFDRFEQLDGYLNDRSAGSGLGLAIAKFLVELMQGEITVSSEVGQGSCFQFALDLERAALDAATESAPPSVDRRLRLLVVDDVELNRELVLAMLATSQHQVQTASNGVEALERLQQSHFDLVLMDVRMPVMDGLSATRAIRLNPKLRELPVIAMTAQALPEQIRECERAGMSDYLPKPMTVDALNAMIGKWGGVSGGESEFDEREVLERLRNRFLARCARELDLLRSRHSQSAEAVHDAVHRLAGSARLFGFAGVSAAAMRLDQRIGAAEEPEEADYEALIVALKALIEDPSDAAS